MSLLDTAVDVASFLDEQEIPYVVIGGLAVQYWGEARTTRDIDIMVLVAPEKIDAFLDAAVRRFKPRLQDAVSFAHKNRMLLLADEDGTPVDISLGIPDYEEEVIRHAALVKLPDDHVIHLISPEDLIIHKCIAGRPRDQEDIERVLIRQKLSVDITYIRKWLEEFVDLINDHNVISVFESALEQARIELEQGQQ